MAQVLHRRGRIQLRLAIDEREALLHVVDQLTPMLGQALKTMPRAYADDKHQADFDRWVQPEIERGRDADIETVHAALAAGEDTMILTEPTAYAWLRALNHLRLAAAGVLRIDSDNWDEHMSPEQRNQPEYRMLTLLSWLQEEFVAALEA